MSNPGRSFATAVSSIIRQHAPRGNSPLNKYLRPTPISRSLVTQSRPRYAQAGTSAAKPIPQTSSSKPQPPAQSTSKPVVAAAATNTASPAEPTSQQPTEIQDEQPTQIDWTKSFHGLSTEPFAKEAAEVLLAPLSPDDVEIKPDGIIYLPEIKYRRILNKAFGPGAWGLAPRGETIVTDKAVTREYALLAHGRLVSIARGEQDYFSKDGIPTASEGCKSNAMMRCCKDLGVASELWDPRFIRSFKKEHTREVFVEHQISKKKHKIWVRKGDAVNYPYKESKLGS